MDEFVAKSKSVESLRRELETLRSDTSYDCRIEEMLKHFDTETSLIKSSFEAKLRNRERKYNQNCKRMEIRYAKEFSDLDTELARMEQDEKTFFVKMFDKVLKKKYHAYHKVK